MGKLQFYRTRIRDSGTNIDILLSIFKVATKPITCHASNAIVIHFANQNFVVKMFYASVSNNFSMDDLISIVNVMSVDRLIRKLKLGKANGPNGLSSEHLVNANPSLVLYLYALIRSMILHGIVTDAFDFDIIVPIMKDKTGDANSINNYRGSFPVIWKLFEILLLDYFENVLLTDDLSSASNRV